MSEQRDWDEYLAWTRGAAPGQYESTEEKAWRRLEDARLRRSVATFDLVAPEPEPASTYEIEDPGFDRGF